MRVLTVIALLVSNMVFGQYNSLQSQYMFNPIAMNPGATGSENAMSIVGTFRAQWIGFPGAPTTEAITAHAPLKNMNSSIGVQIFADQIGVDNNTTLNGLYSYRFKLGKTSLRLGLAAGLSFVQANYSELSVFDEDDAQVSSNTPVGVIPNFGFGAYYTAENYFVSFSIPTLLGHRFEDNRFRSFSDVGNYNFLLGGGVDIDLKNELVLKPSFLLKMRANNRPQVDINAKLKLNPVFYIGMSYRTEEAVIGMFEAKVTNQFHVMYSFGVPISDIVKNSFGSHELSVKYNFVYQSNSQSPRFSGW